MLNGSSIDNKKSIGVIKKFIDTNSGYISNDTQLKLIFIQLGNDVGLEYFLEELKSENPECIFVKKESELNKEDSFDQLIYYTTFNHVEITEPISDK